MMKDRTRSVDLARNKCNVWQRVWPRSEFMGNAYLTKLVSLDLLNPITCVVWLPSVLDKVPVRDLHFKLSP